MKDKILEAYLGRQFEEGSNLAENSDLLDLMPLEGQPPHRYLAHLTCNGLVRTAAGEVVESNSFLVGIQFPEHHLDRFDPDRVLTWLHPLNVFHPNVLPPFCCLGRLPPGASLVELLYQVFELITFNRLTMREDDALNHAACVWSRQNQHRFPIDSRPLRRRTLSLRVESVEEVG